MRVGVERRENATLLHLQGDFDTFVCKPLLEKVDSLIDVGDRNVVLNLSRVKFINSTALGTIVKIRKTLQAEEGALAISSPSEVCRRVLGSVGLDKVLTISRLAGRMFMRSLTCESHTSRSPSSRPPRRHTTALRREASGPRPHRRRRSHRERCHRS